MGYNIEKLALNVLLKREDNFCAKCCKTRQIVDQILDSVPELKEKVEISFEDVDSKATIKKYGIRVPPTIFLDEKLYIEGHVPTIKKLAKEMLDFLNNGSKI